MEFSLGNTCNLECIMCSGLYSSAIRARRDGLAPVPSVYPDEFFDSLRKYLPHLAVARFDGGEPFLMEEYYRIWEAMAEEAPLVRCHVTTNGTVLNSRMERLMERLDFDFAVSLDGTTKETVEGIRSNLDFGAQQAILQRLRTYTRERQTTLALRFCLMRQNWHELGDVCLMAEDWGCSVSVNGVRDAPHLSIESLPAPELRKILDAMDHQAAGLDSQLVRNHRAWFGELERLREHCRKAEVKGPVS
jgi:MoaA/NifB/PqqE/SkfB family radical SAM enzyme